MRSALALLVGLAALALGAGLYLWQQGGAPARRLDFALTDLDGATHRAADWDGKVLVLNFWAPWCEPCRDEIPMLNALQRELGPRGLQVLGFTVDEAAPARRFAAEAAFAYPVLLGLDPILELQSRYGDTRLPFTVVIDRAGRVAWRQAGEVRRPELEQVLAPLL